MRPLHSKSLLSSRLYSTRPTSTTRQLTLHDLTKKYKLNKPITMCTAHDFITSQWVQRSNIDILLIGDSLAMTTLGYDSTVPLTMQEFKYHIKSILRYPGESFIVCDMPYGSFEQNETIAIGNAIEITKVHSRINSLKVECGNIRDEYTIGLIGKLVNRGFPIMGHIGLTPQRVNSLGGFKVQANKSVQAMLDIYQLAQKLQKIGCWGLVLECIPWKLAKFITQKLNVPTIGIGAGNATSGQVLVVSDLLSMQTSLQDLTLDSNNASSGTGPRFVKRYGQIMDQSLQALQNYKNDVENRVFPETNVHTFKLNDEVFAEFTNIVNKNSK